MVVQEMIHLQTDMIMGCQIIDVYLTAKPWKSIK